MAEPYIAEVRVFAFAFAPKGWAICAGQLYPISQQTVLFSLIGATYGGNGTSTFALPDLRERAVLGAGAGRGLSSYDRGEIGGQSTVQLSLDEMGAHTHGFNVANAVGTTTASQGAMLGYVSSGGTKVQSVTGQMYSASPQPNAGMSRASIVAAGSGQPHDNLMPYVAMTFCIAMEGFYPPRPTDAPGQEQVR